MIIEDLEVFANHGVFEEEERLGQKFLVSAKLYFDTSVAGKNDDIDRSVDYAKTCLAITEWMKTNRCKLIETVAERLAEKLLKDHPIVRKVDVTVKKPWAPIGLPVGCVSITISRGWHTVYLSVGSNMGDREKYIRDGIACLKERDDVRVLAMSDIINTKPYGKTDQDDFLNGAVKLETLLDPHALLNLLHEVENAAGRKRTEHWGPRTLDMDIIFYDDLVLDDDDLVIPHPDMCNREFVLMPLCAIAPHVIHPLCNKTVEQLLHCAVTGSNREN